MTLTEIFESVDQLTPDELNQLYEYIAERRRTTWWIVENHNLKNIQQVMQPVVDESLQYSDDEINSIIDEAITEVRSERKNQSRD